MRLLIAFMFISTFAVAQTQTFDSLKLPVAEAKKLDDIDKRLKELEPQRFEIQYLEGLRATIIESAYNHAKKPVPEAKQYVNGVLLSIPEKKPVASAKKP